MKVEDGFQQTPFDEGHPFLDDPALPSLLRRLLPEDSHSQITQELVHFGDRVTSEIRNISAQVYPPTLTQYDQWGRRVDTLHTSEAWRKLKAFAQEEGMVASFYERVYGEHSRVYGFSKYFLMVGDNQVVFCPISMTDGCARVLELMGTPEMKRDIYPRLISRDSQVAFTSGQWMTEKPGGSDVSQTETTAMPTSSSQGQAGQPGSKYTLDGFKWFSSATDSDVSLALGRTGPASGGSRALSLFLIPLRLPLLRGPADPTPLTTTNRIAVHRLKNKIGTKVVPTAELELSGTEAWLLSPLGQGVKAITPVLNITRIHSAAGSVGSVRRCLAIATGFAKVRTVQGNRTLLRDAPLHVAELAKVGVLYRGMLHFLFGTIHLLGKTECGVATADEVLRLRLLTPMLKAFAAEKACTAMEECMAALGGQGYMEENDIGRMIRDCLVEKIWEGTIVVLSLDVVRAARDKTAITAYVKWAKTIIDSTPRALAEQLTSPLEALQGALSTVSTLYTAASMPPLAPRPAIILFGYVTAALYLLEHTVWSYERKEEAWEVDIDVLKRWIGECGMAAAREDVERVCEADGQRIALDKEIVFGRERRAGAARL